LVVLVVARPGHGSDAAGEPLADPRLVERDSLQFRFSQKPLERGDFTPDVFEPLDVIPPDRMAAYRARRTESTCGQSPSDDLQHAEV